MSTVLFSSAVVLTKAEVTANSLARYTKERLCVVDSDASLHVIAFFEQKRAEKCSTVKQHLGYSDRQWHCGLRHTSKGLHQGVWSSSMGSFGARFSVSAIVGRLAMSLVILSRGCQEKFPCYSKVRKWSNRVAPSTDFSSAWGNFEREREVEDTVLDLLQQVTEGMEEYNASSSTPNAGSDEAWSCRRKPLDDKLPSVVTDAEGD